MGEVNNIVCDYLGRPGYYADFWNGTVFRGKRKIKIWQLQRHDREYYKSKNKKGKTENVRRDAQMRCKGKKDGLLKFEEAAKRANMSEEMFGRKMQELL